MVFIDIQKKGWSHLVASSLEELHEFAKKIGCKPEWAQVTGKNKYRPHYDVTGKVHRRAIEEGAIKITTKQLVKFLKEKYLKTEEMVFITEEQMKQEVKSFKFPKKCGGIRACWLKDDPPLLAVRRKVNIQPEGSTFFIRDGSGKYINVV